MNLRDALKIARQLGCEVEPVKATGEIKISHPSWSTNLRINSRKKSAPIILTGKLSQLTKG